MPEEILCRRRRLSSFQIIIIGFAGVILLGALLLMLPISTTNGRVTPFNETLFTATSAVCVTGLARYWELLVGLRADDYSGADSNRRPWRRNRSSIVRSAVRAKNLPDAAQHNTGCDLSTEGRWNRSTDTVHPAGDISNRTAGCTCYDAGILPELWMARSLDGGVSFHISILQRWV